MDNYILVVDDDPDIRESMQILLELEGHQVRSACNGLQALHALQSDEPPCLVLLDLSMPVMTGMELLDKLNAGNEYTPPPVVVISALADHVDLGDSAQPVEVLTKPVAFEDLNRVVNRYCPPCGRGSSQGFSASVA